VGEVIMSRIFVSLLVLLGLVAGYVGVPASAAAQDKVKSHFTIKVPPGDPAGYPKETILTVGGEPTKQQGAERKFVTTELDKGANYAYEIVAVIEPNNYTVITRKKTVKFKGGDEVSVDMT
jgi:uncharacterized protein (TIGR03000 family)